MFPHSHKNENRTLPRNNCAGRIATNICRYPYCIVDNVKEALADVFAKTNNPRLGHHPLQWCCGRPSRMGR